MCSLFCGSENLSVCFAKCSRKNNPRLYRPKTLFVIMLRRQMLMKEVPSLSRWWNVSEKKSYRTRDIDNRRFAFYECVRAYGPAYYRKTYDAMRALSRSSLHTHTENRPVLTNSSVSLRRCCWSEWAPVYGAKQINSTRKKKKTTSNLCIGPFTHCVCLRV